MVRLINHLRQIEDALAEDDAIRAGTLITHLADELGEPLAIAVAERLIIERTERRLDAAAAAAGARELARCA